jgi:murein DD-endopeptidase MepM/ murein hydrolase activator NlpD
MSPARRPGGPVLLAGLGGFALGAATVLFVLWSYNVARQDAVGGATAWLPPPTLGNSGSTRPRPEPPPSSWPPPPLAAPPGSAPGTPGSTPAPGAAPTPGAPTPAAPAAPTNPPVTPVPDAPTTAAPEAPAPAAPTGSPDIDALRQRRLLLPVQGIRPEQLNDTFADGRGNHAHEALDIMAARNTPILAVEDGRLVKLFFSRYGGNTIYQFDPSQTYTYYYAHLERYADGLREGDALRRGQVIGYVGTTGDAPPNAPHLHFAIFRLNADRHWWQGTAINPFPVFHLP